MPTIDTRGPSYRFGRFTLDLSRGRLRTGDREIALRPKTLAVLKVIVENHGHLVEKEELFQRVWKGTAVTDDSLTQCLIEIRKAIGDVDKTIVRTVPRRGLIFDIPVEVIDHADAAAQTAGTFGRDRTPGLLAAMVLILLAVSLAVLNGDRDPDHHPSNLGDRSIAVLPFENRSADANDAYLVDGMHDDILSSLAKVGSLKVISRTSVGQFADTTKTVVQIGEELGVSSILEGGVQRAGNRIRVNVQLIDAETDTHIWVGQYDRELTAANVFSIQSEIARSVAVALETVLSADERSRVASPLTDSLEAYRAFLHGTQLLQRRTGTSILAATRSFAEALQIDPNFALARVGLADSYLLSPNVSAKRPEEAFPLALAEARAAIELDPTLGEAYASLAMVHHEARRGGVELNSSDDPGELFRRALELSPNYATAYQWYGEYLGQAQHHDEALVQYRKALEIDPRSPILHHVIGRNFELLGRLDEAETHLRKATDIDPGFSKAYQGLAAIYFGHQGRLADAALAAHRSVVLDRGHATNIALLANIYLHLGDVVRARLWLEEAEQLQTGHPVVTYVGVLLDLREGRLDAAFETATRVYRQPDGYSASLSFIVRDGLLRRGEVDAALAVYEDRFSTCQLDDRWLAVECAFALQKVGRSTEAQRVLDHVENLIDDHALARNVELHALLALIHAQGGDDRTSLASLRVAFDKGWRRFGFYLFDHSPVFDDLRATPAFQALAAEYRADMAAQREAATRVIEGLGASLHPEQN